MGMAECARQTPAWKNRRAKLAAVAAVVGAWSMLTGGCASSALPPPITPAQHGCLVGAHFGVDVGVERFRFPVYSTRLMTALTGTRLFDRVDTLDAFETAPAYVARVERTIYGVAGVP